jgi:hypothetical protein
VISTGRDMSAWGKYQEEGNLINKCFEREKLREHAQKNK